MKKYLLSAVVVMLSVAAMANDAVINSIFKQNATYKNIVCNFNETENAKLSKKVTEMSGKLYYQGEQFSMIYSVPAGDFLKLSDVKFARQKGNSKINKTMNSTSPFMSLRNLLVYSIRGDIKALADMTKSDIQYVSSANTDDFTFVSKEKGVKAYNKVVLKFNKKTKVLEYMELHKPTGDFTSYVLKDIKIGTEIPAGVF